MIMIAALNKSDIDVDRSQYPMFFTKKEPHEVSFDWDYGSMLRILNSCKAKVPGNAVAMTSPYEVSCREVIYDFIADLTSIRRMLGQLKRNTNIGLTLMYPVAIKVTLDADETPKHIRSLSDMDISQLTMGMQLLVGKRYTSMPDIKVAKFTGSTISVLCVPESHSCNLVSTYLHFLRDGSKEMIDYFISVGKQYSAKDMYITASEQHVDGLSRILLKKYSHMHRGYMNTDHRKNLDVLFAMCIYFGNESSYSHFGNGPISGGTYSITSREAVGFCERFLKEVKEKIGPNDIKFSDYYYMDVIYKIRSALLLAEMKKESEL